MAVIALTEKAWKRLNDKAAIRDFPELEPIESFRVLVEVQDKRNIYLLICDAKEPDVRGHKVLSDGLAARITMGCDLELKNLETSPHNIEFFAGIDQADIDGLLAKLKGGT